MIGPNSARWTRALRRDGGFTLVELMIVVAIIAILAAIAIPNLISARLRANESAAISVMRTVSTAQAQFRQTARADENRNDIGEYGSFGELTGSIAVRGGTTIGSSQLTRSMANVDANGEVQRNGYYYRLYLPAPGGAGVREQAGGGLPVGVLDADASENCWVLYAYPALHDSSGTRTFFVSHRGDLLWTESAAYERSNCAVLQPGAALVTSDPLNCTALPAVGGTGADGNAWKMVQ